MRFGFKDLDVWKKAVDFAGEVIAVTEKLETPKKHYRLVENAEVAVVSIAANIAEGKGRASKREFIQYLYIARGSLYETVTVLDIFRNIGWICDTDYNKLLTDAEEIVRMISGLIGSLQRKI